MAGSCGGGHTGWGVPPNWLFAGPREWIVGPRPCPIERRSEDSCGLFAVAAGMDREVKLIVVLLMA